VVADEKVEHINGTVDKVESTADRMYKLVRFMAFMGIVGFVFLLALQWQILQLDDKTDKSIDNSDKNAETIATVEEEVAELRQFTRELQEVTPEEMASSQAIQHAVALVPIILQVLCEVNPEAPSCQGG
jgi:hypothetical protein